MMGYILKEAYRGQINSQILESFELCKTWEKP